MLPTCCFPLWGREGVTLQAAAENKRITEKRGFQQSQSRFILGQSGVVVMVDDSSLFFISRIFFNISSDNGVTR